MAERATNEQLIKYLDVALDHIRQVYNELYARNHYCGSATRALHFIEQTKHDIHE